MNKTKDIVNQQKKQRALKAEIKEIKKKLPTYIIGFVLFACISLYFLEDKFYAFFGNSVDFVRVIVIISGLFSLFFIFKSYLKIKKKEKNLKQ